MTKGLKNCFSVGVCTGLAILLSGCITADVSNDKSYAFGAIADCQYCKKPSTGVRKYSMSVKKLQDCVNDLNGQDLKFAVHLGDFIDRDFESFGVVMPIFDQLKMPGYHVLGNHDFSVADDLKKTVPATLGLPSRYYHYLVNGWRYVVLDGNDVSFHAYSKDSAGYRRAGDYYKEKGLKSPKWNGAIGDEQMAWLQDTLKGAEKDNEKVILFCHFPVYPKNGHNLWNDDEVIAMLEKFDCVKAYINGHNHKGGYGLKGGIHYLTLKGMVDTTESSYAVITLDESNIVVKGYGREQDRVLKIDSGNEGVVK